MFDNPDNATCLLLASVIGYILGVVTKISLSNLIAGLQLAMKLRAAPAPTSKPKPKKRRRAKRKPVE